MTSAYETITTRTPDLIVRRWAKRHGLKTPARGPVPQAVRDAYDQAHQAPGAAATTPPSSAPAGSVTPAPARPTVRR